MVNSKEIWKDIQGYEGLYQISNFGHVRSLKIFAKSKSHSKRTVNPRLLKGGLDVDGYHPSRGFIWKYIKKDAD